MSYLNTLAAFGQQPSLGQRVDEGQALQSRTRHTNLLAQQMQQEMTGQNTLRELYGRYAAGDQGALQQMASVDPNTHMALQKQQAEAQAQQKQQEAKELIFYNTPEKWAASRFGQQGIPFEQRDALLGEVIGSGDALKTVFDQQNNEASRNIQMRGQDITMRGQDITLRGQDLTDARARDKNQIDSSLVTQEQFKDANTLRDEFNKGSGDFIKVRDAFRRIEASAANPSPAGDMSLVFNYMKVLDPGSTVREGEYANARNAASIPVQIRNAYNQAVSGEILSPSQRNDFVSQARGLYSAQEESHLKLQSEYERLATRRGIDPQDVVVDYRLDSTGNLNGDKPPGAAKVGDVVEANGKKYRITGLSPDGNHDIEPVP